MYGEINATAALYNMEGVDGNGFALNMPWYIADLDDLVSRAEELYGWRKRWWVRGRAYYDERDTRQFNRREVTVTVSLS